MRVLLGMVMMALCATHVQAMSCSGVVNGQNYDLSSLRGTDVAVVPLSGAYNYYINPCGSVQASTCSSHGEVFACQTRKSPVDQFESVLAFSDETGHPPAAIWGPSSVNAAAGVKLTFTNGDTCNLKQRVAIIDFHCDKSGTQPTVLESPQCTFNIDYPTPVVCPGFVPPFVPPSGGGGSSDEKSGLSGGWIFIIILLVGGFVAFISGCLYKRQKLGAVGVEAVPLIDFWREFPRLVLDGCRFSYNKTRSLCGGRGAASTDTYETIK